MNSPGGSTCTVAGGSGMTCHWIRQNVRHIGILHLVSISTISPQSTCHSAPVCEILSKSDHPRQKKMTSCRFWRWRISTILDFMGPIMGSLKSPCMTSYRSSISQHRLLFLENRVFLHFGDRQTNRETDEQMDSIDALSRSRCRERRLNKVRTTAGKPASWNLHILVFSQCKFAAMQDLVRRLWKLTELLLSNLFHHPVATSCILVFPHQTLRQYSDGDFPNEDVECRGMNKVAILDQYLALSRKWYKIRL